MKHTLPILLAALLVLAACQAPTQEPYETTELEIATQWIQQAPTYAHDGENLALTEYYVQESYPERHVLTFSFTSRTAGYGDRSDELVAQVLTDHEIRVVIVEEEVVSAVIDGVWDEVAQEMLLEQQPTDPNEPVTQVTFQPMQCEEYFFGNTAEEMQNYYEQQGAVLTVERVDTDRMVCQACSICPTTHYYQATIQEGEEILLADDWQEA
ncbi:MAG: hypothetical protein ACMXYD_00015 [Candidatus Woesearchaeota archaeon]